MWFTVALTRVVHLEFKYCIKGCIAALSCPSVSHPSPASISSTSSIPRSKMFFKGDVFVGLFRQGAQNCHWGILFLDSDFENMEFIHVKGSFVAGWQLDWKTRYSVTNSNSLLRLVHIGRVRDHRALIPKIFQAVPARNDDTSFDCKAWVLRAIMFMVHNGDRIRFSRGSNINDLAGQCQYFADTAAVASNGAPQSPTRLDIRTASACIIPPVSTSW